MLPSYSLCKITISTGQNTRPEMSGKALLAQSFSPYLICGTTIRGLPSRVKSSEAFPSYPRPEPLLCYFLRLASIGSVCPSNLASALAPHLGKTLTASTCLCKVVRRSDWQYLSLRSQRLSAAEIPLPLYTLHQRPASDPQILRHPSPRSGRPS